MASLIADLKALRLDGVPSTTPPEPDETARFAVQPVSQQIVSLRGPPDRFSRQY